MKSKVKTYAFWVALSGAVVLLVESVAEMFGFKIESNTIENVIMSICGVLVVLGIVTKSSTETQEQKDVKFVEEQNNIEQQVENNKTISENAEVDVENEKSATEESAEQVNNLQIVETKNNELNILQTENFEQEFVSAEIIEQKVVESDYVKSIQQLIENMQTSIAAAQQILTTLKPQQKLEEQSEMVETIEEVNTKNDSTFQEIECKISDNCAETIVENVEHTSNNNTQVDNKTVEVVATNVSCNEHLDPITQINLNC